MTENAAPLPDGVALPLDSLVATVEHGIASRVLARTRGGNLTLSSFAAGEGLSEHTAPFDAFVLDLEGALTLTIGGSVVEARPGTIVRMPARVPHALDASADTRMLLVMLRDRTD